MNFERLPSRVRPPLARPDLPPDPISPSSLAPAHSVLALLALVILGVTPLAAQSLLGSHESLMRQNLVAQQNDYAYLRTPHDVMLAVEAGTLVPIDGNADYQLAMDEVSYPYARPQVKAFLAQLAPAYREACGEPLVVTSLTRPITRQPWNASPISVHPTGMAIDLRRSLHHACRHWMESTLLALEAGGMIEATRELWPAHYHVAIFPDRLLLPGPIGDPQGLIRLAALHHDSALAAEAADAALGGRVHVTRGRHGRLQITQAAIARRAGARRGSISIHRTATAAHRHRRGHAPATSRHTGAGGHKAPRNRSTAVQSTR